MAKIQNILEIYSTLGFTEWDYLNLVYQLKCCLTEYNLFIILWMTKLIHNKQPMYAVLDKDTIKTKYCPVFQ